MAAAVEDAGAVAGETAARHDAIALAGPMRVLPGTACGQRQPVLLVALRVAAPSQIDFASLDRAIATLVDLPEAPDPETDPNRALAMRALGVAVALQAGAGHPVFDRGVVTTPSAQGTFLLAVPHDAPEAARIAARWAVRRISALAAAASPGPAEVSPALAADAVGVKRAIRLRRRSVATATLHLLAAATTMDVPWRYVAGIVYQVGHGVRSRLLNSTMTDATPSIGSALAQNKQQAAELLRAHGLPAPRHEIAASVDDAVRIAARLGYPVVVKPVDLDAGIGVAAGLRDEPSLRRAFAAAAALDKPVLVEKHVEGEDFRLVVTGGRTVWAIARQPGGVTGDGTSTIEALHRSLNADPRRGNQPGALLRRIEWDAEAAALVAEQGLDPASIPPAGRFVALRRVANIATGGMPVSAMDRIHPENLRMAERAAAAFGLDIAGIDYITPDIGRPWHAVPGIINEVNAQPNLGMITARHLFGELVGWMLGGTDGRIPIVAFTGGGPAARAALGTAVHAILRADGRCAGLALRRGAWIGDRQVAWTDMSGFPGGRLLLGDRQVEAAVIEMPAERTAAFGVPFDACDVVAHLGDAEPTPISRDLASRARRALVVPPGAAGHRPAEGASIVLVGEAGDRRVARHVAGGGAAVWRGRTGDATTLHLASGRAGAPAEQLTLPGAPAAAAVYAAAIAVAMGCTSEAIGRALAARIGEERPTEVG
ncbi:MAG: acetate--CoA ligase family protein [Alphaproteobacteria bacterium]